MELQRSCGQAAYSNIRTSVAGLQEPELAGAEP